MSAKNETKDQDQDQATADDRQVVFMRGNSRGARHGDRRTVTAAQAAQLVADGLATYPKGRR